LYNHFAGRLNVTLTVAENHARTIRGELMDNETSGKGDADSSAASRSEKNRAGKTGAKTPEPAAAR
jgi:hypothetical protein